MRSGGHTHPSEIASPLHLEPSPGRKHGRCRALLAPANPWAGDFRPAHPMDAWALTPYLASAAHAPCSLEQAASALAKDPKPSP